MTTADLTVVKHCSQTHTGVTRTTQRTYQGCSKFLASYTGIKKQHNNSDHLSKQSLQLQCTYSIVPVAPVSHPVLQLQKSYFAILAPKESPPQTQ